MKPEFETFSEFIANGKFGSPLTNSVGRAPMTRSRLQSLILQGFGQGRGNDYIPWIRVTRGNAPRKSNHYVAPTSVQEQSVHLMSGIEYGALRMAAWLGAEEVRTQFPLWPWSGHPHPMAGLDPAGDRKLARTVGLLEIAKKAGIKHGCFVGTPGLPYVATTDLVLTIRASSTRKLVFWTCKPSEQLERAEANVRVHERITLERLYALEVDAFQVEFDDKHSRSKLVTNLDWLEPPRQELTDQATCAVRTEVAGFFNQCCSSDSIEKRIEHAASCTGLSIESAQRHFRAASWLGQIDIDLSKPILMTRPMKTGGASVKRALRQALLGESAGAALLNQGGPFAVLPTSPLLRKA